MCAFHHLSLFESYFFCVKNVVLPFWICHQHVILIAKTNFDTFMAGLALTKHKSSGRERILTYNGYQYRTNYENNYSSWKCTYKNGCTAGFRSHTTNGQEIISMYNLNHTHPADASNSWQYQSNVHMTYNSTGQKVIVNGPPPMHHCRQSQSNVHSWMSYLPYVLLKK